MVNTSGTPPHMTTLVGVDLRGWSGHIRDLSHLWVSFFCLSCFIEHELLPIEIVHCENSDFRPFLLLWPLPWRDDHYVRTWPVFFGDIPDVQIWTYFTARLSTKFATKWSLHIPPHLKGNAALPSETVMFQLLASSGANIQTSKHILGLLLPHFQWVLSFFFSFFSSVSSLPFIQFFVENSANNPCEP